MMDINVSNLLKTYGEIIAVDIKHMTVNSGQIFGLLGVNGAGKTTLLRLILDLVQADNGAVYIDNYNVTDGSKWKKITGAYLDESFLFPFLNPLEYFQFVGKVYGYSSTEIDDMLYTFRTFYQSVDITGNGKLIRDCSTGNKQKVGLISAMMIRPKLLILDEPFSSLDPAGQEKLKEYFRLLQNDNGTTILISSHNLYHVKDICNRIGIMEHGRISEVIDSRKTSLNDLYKFFK